MVISLVSFVGWGMLVSSWIVPKLFNFKDKIDKYIWGMILAAGSVGIFLGAMLQGITFKF